MGYLDLYNRVTRENASFDDCLNIDHWLADKNPEAWNGEYWDISLKGDGKEYMMPVYSIVGYIVNGRYIFSNDIEWIIDNAD